jgi:hypothetical protein
MYNHICACLSRSAGSSGDLRIQNLEVVAESLEEELKQDIPRILPHLNITAELIESRGALYEPVMKLIKCYQTHRPDMNYTQPMLYIALQCAQFLFHQEYQRFLVFTNLLAKQVL